MQAVASLRIGLSMQTARTLELIQGSFAALTSLPIIQGKAFDLIVSFQALMT
jgi:hypothetical protein